MTTIYIDADACPVRRETVRVAERHELPVVIVSNGGLRPEPHPLVSYRTVPEGPDVADDWIAERAGPGDLCITADIPLAARCVEAGAAVLSHDGEEFTTANIGSKLATRDLMADLRAAAPLGQFGGAKPFSKADRSRFMNALERVLRKLAAGS